MPALLDHSRNGVTRARREAGWYWVRFPRRHDGKTKAGPLEVARYVVDDRGWAAFIRVGKAGLWEEAWVGPRIEEPEDQTVIGGKDARS